MGDPGLLGTVNKREREESREREREGERDKEREGGGERNSITMECVLIVEMEFWRCWRVGCVYNQVSVLSLCPDDDSSMAVAATFYLSDWKSRHVYK